MYLPCISQVDELLRSNAMVDLYEVVRHALLVGEPRYSPGSIY